MAEMDYSKGSPFSYSENKYLKENIAGIRSPFFFSKIRGGNIAPKPGGNAWRGLHSEWDWDNWIKPQVDRAALLGLNSVRLIGGPYAIFAVPAGYSQITQEVYDLHWEQLAQYCLSKNMLLYPCLVSKWDYLDRVIPYSDTAMLNSLKTTASVLAKYPNIIGFDIFQEGGEAAWFASTTYALGDVRSNGGNAYQCIGAGTSAGSGGPTGTNASIVDGTVTWKYLIPSLALSDLLNFSSELRTISNIKITMSRSMSDGFGWQDTSSLHYQFYGDPAGADYLDFHIYTDGVIPGNMDFQAIKANKPLLIGEFGANQSEAGGIQTARFSALMALHARGPVMGSFVWALADQKTSASPVDQWGVWDNTGYALGISPLSLTSGKRASLTVILSRFSVGSRIEETFKNPDLLNALQSSAKNVSSTTNSGWVAGTNTSLIADARGIGFSANAIGTTFIATAGNIPVHNFAVKPNTYYEVEADFQAATTGRTVSLNIDWYDSSNVYITSGTATPGTDAPNAPIRLRNKVKSHANAAYGRIIGKVTDAAQALAEVHIIDNAHIREVA